MDQYKELEETGSKWRRNKKNSKCYSASEERKFLRLKSIALAVETIKNDSNKEELLNKWQQTLIKKGIAPLVSELQQEGVIEKGKSRKSKKNTA